MRLLMKRNYIEFQDRSVAKGFLITFRTFGKWLHGDERGSVDRRSRNAYGTPKIQTSDPMIWTETANSKQDAFILSSQAITVVDRAIRDLCETRGYTLSALNVRTNHVHAVTGNKGKVERMMDSFKAFATKELRHAGLVASDFKPWSRHGSTMYLWTEEHVNAAVHYVLNRQGDDLIEFDRDAK